MPKSCFFISRIGDDGSPEREFSDKLLRYIVTPVLEKCGYETPVRADHITKPGVITTDVFTHIWNDDLVIADLTGGNPNVFYELAVRHIRRKPFVHLIHAGEKIPFDIAPNRTLSFGFDIEKAEAAKSVLMSMVIGIDDAPLTLQTPLSAAIDFAGVGSSKNPLHDGISQILSLVQEIRGLLDVPKVVESVPRRQMWFVKKVPGGYSLADGYSRTLRPRVFATTEALQSELASRMGSEKAANVLEHLEITDSHLRIVYGPGVFGVRGMSTNE